MAIASLGEVTDTLANTTTDKVLTVDTDLDPGTFVAVYWAGYGGSGLTMTGVTDDGSNTYTVVEAKQGTTTVMAAIAYAKLTTGLSIGDNISINISGTHTRSRAFARAFTGLSATPEETQTGNGNSSTMDTTGDLDRTRDSRVMAIVAIRNEYAPNDYWSGSMSQVDNYQDNTNVWMASVGEHTYTSSGSVTPTFAFPVSNNFAIAALTVPAAIASSGQAIFIG